MGLFNNKPARTNGPLSSTAFESLEPEAEAVDYQSAMEYLEGLSEQDFDKVYQVATIYRKANQEVAVAMGIDDEPTTFITPPENTELAPGDVNHLRPKTMLDDDDDLTAAFLDDDEIDQKKIEVKG